MKSYEVAFGPRNLLIPKLWTDSSALEEWHNKLHSVQDASLNTWRDRTVHKAVSKLRESLSLAVAQSPEAMIWAWEGESAG